jgi:peptide/nickel transport system substrate-binding protein
LLATVLVFLLAGCDQNPNSTTPNSRVSNGEQTKKETISVYVGDEPEAGFDPTTGWGMSGYMLFQSGLLKFDKQLQLENDLATAYQISADGLTYTFTVREDARFSDGSPLTAEDVAFTYETAKNSASDLDLTMLEAAQASDSQTVVLTLNKPLSTFLSTAAQVGIVPKASYDPLTYPENPLGSGPYQLVQWDRGQQAIIKPNEHYYGTPSFFKQITLVFLDEKTALANAQSGALDVVMVQPEYAKEPVANMHLETFDTVDNRGFSLPVIPPDSNAATGAQVGNALLSDVAVRQALKIGINRQTIIDNALNGIGTPAFTSVDQLAWYNPQTVYADGRIDEARHLLDAAGWLEGPDGIRVKDGVSAQTNVFAPASDLQRYNIAVAFAAEAKNLGIDIKVEAKSWDECYAQGYATPILWGFGDYNPINLRSLYYTGATYNFASYTNKIVDTYINAALQSVSQQEALENWKRAQWDGTTGPESEKGDSPFIWLVNIDHCYLVADGLNLGEQPVHPHGHGWPVLNNLNEWVWE